MVGGMRVLGEMWRGDESARGRWSGRDESARGR